MADPNESGEGKGPSTSSDDANLSARLDRLKTQLGHRGVREPRPETANRSTSHSSAIGQAFRLSAEFVSGVIAGGIVGWVVDRLSGWSPWGLVVCLILGFCAGMLNLMRSAGMVKSARFDDKDSGG